MAGKTKAEKIAAAEARRKAAAEVDKTKAEKLEQAKAAANPPSPPEVATGPVVDPNTPPPPPLPSPPTVATGPVNGEPDPKVQAQLDEQQKALDEAAKAAEPEPEPKTRKEKAEAERRANATPYHGDIAVGPTGSQQIDPAVQQMLAARQAEIDKGRTEAELDAEIGAAVAGIEDEDKRRKAKEIIKAAKAEEARKRRSGREHDEVDKTPKMHGNVADLKAPY